MQGLQPIVDASVASADDPQDLAQPILVQQDLLQQVELLKQQGGSLHDPVRFRFIESLIHRSLEQRESVRDRLLKKAQLELDEYKTIFAELAAEPAIEKVSPSLNQLSSAVLALSSLRKVLADDVIDNTVSGSGSNDVTVDTVESMAGGSVAIRFAEQLIQQEQRLLNGDKTQKITRSSAPLLKLKAGVVYQQFQHQQRVDHFIDSAFNETPETPGPLNPEILTIKLLRQINDLSPAYISRYVGYFETLQRLAQEIPPAPKQKK
ncbi:MAG: hypothetical protein ACJA0C_001563 [Candidatus Endobugula sp.]|jgi:hypothetical protein